MQANDQRCPSPRRAVAVTLGIALATLLPLTTASATEVGVAPTGTYSARVAPPGPQLSIAVDNGRSSAAVGDTPTYTITISNLGTAKIDELVVTQSVPTGLNFMSADSAGIDKARMVSWRIDLKASGKATLHTTMTISPTPTDLLRLATVACASMATNGPPIVCATHSDQLPAGADAQAGQAKVKAATGAGTAATSTGRNGWYAAGGLGGIVLVMGAFVALTLRRRRARDDRKQPQGAARQPDA
jgi:uncharacterized repeat protein (TIGR01451 family)